MVTATGMGQGMRFLQLGILVLVLVALWFQIDALYTIREVNRLGRERDRLYNQRLGIIEQRLTTLESAQREKKQ